MVNHETLVVEMEGLDRLWTFKNRLEIPLKHTIRAKIDPQWVREHHLIGEHAWRGSVQVPGIISTGMYYQDSGKVFWDVHDPDMAVVIELKDDQYSCLVLQVDDPAFTVSQINQAVGASTES
ncbi:MAG: hypothetical protein ACJ788_12360 [Ktedonobacteraceae bacterium]